MSGDFDFDFEIIMPQQGTPSAVSISFSRDSLFRKTIRIVLYISLKHL